ncbi:hypothetical protein HMPREF9123_0978 [Neisseria bacilliformis ATCC BAA-1200]|uniref:Uncharacterized protein n=1 Tax=Neisseria bacilliformis ATCC BAA-1200 TaxID=888742 RepID=F2BB74_9NEIS|nr:hypothetical protein HMPREF9123_0978 [Neisseria bacilliformis ATCC BAA-1200]
MQGLIPAQACAHKQRPSENRKKRFSDGLYHVRRYPPYRFAISRPALRRVGCVPLLARWAGDVARPRIRFIVDTNQKYPM